MPAIADNLKAALDQAVAAFELREIATEDDRSTVSRQAQAEQQIRLAAASLASEVKLVGLAKPRVRLWSPVREPQRIRRQEQIEQFLPVVTQRGNGFAQVFRQR